MGKTTKGQIKNIWNERERRGIRGEGREGEVGGERETEREREKRGAGGGGGEERTFK